MRFTEEQKMILNCYEGGKTKVIHEVQKSIEELKSTGEDPERGCKNSCVYGK